MAIPSIITWRTLTCNQRPLPKLPPPWMWYNLFVYSIFVLFIFALFSTTSKQEGILSIRVRNKILCIFRNNNKMVSLNTGKFLSFICHFFQYITKPLMICYYSLIFLKAFHVSFITIFFSLFLLLMGQSLYVCIIF